MTVSKDQLQQIYDFLKPFAQENKNDCTFQQSIMNVPGGGSQGEYCLSSAEYGNVNLNPAQQSFFYINGIWHGSYEDVNQLWETAVQADVADGDLNGAIEGNSDLFSVKLSIPISLTPTDYTNKIFYITRKALPDSSSGSGNAWLIDEEVLADGQIRHWLITTASVADDDDSQELKWTTTDGQGNLVSLKLRGVDTTWDVGVLYFDSAERFGSIPVNTSILEANGKSSQTLTVVGDQGNGITTVTGTVNRMDRFSELPLPMVQIDAVTVFVNKGSPVMNEQQEVVGLCQGSPESGITVVTPMQFIQQAFQEIKTKGFCEHGYGDLFYYSTQLDSEALESVGIDNVLNGLLITDTPFMSSFFSQFLPGDIVVGYRTSDEAEGILPIPDDNNQKRLVYDISQNAGREVTFTVYREGDNGLEKIDVSATISSLRRPRYPTQWTEYGFIIKEVDEQYIKYQQDMEFEPGKFLVLEIYKGKSYEFAGILVSVNSQPVTTIEEFQQVLSSTQTQTIAFRYFEFNKFSPNYWSEQVILEPNKANRAQIEE